MRDTSFSKNYFDELYPKGSPIDGDFNAKDHAKYLYSLFSVIEIPINSVFDFGFGKGSLLKAIYKTWRMPRVAGCDISQYAYDRLEKYASKNHWHLSVSEIHNLPTRKRPYDLAICNSVLQYIETKHIDACLRKMAQNSKYLYFHVPTEEDYILLKKTLKFTDPYAIQRSNRFYRRAIAPYFTPVAWGLLESRIHTPRETSDFLDSFYRF